MKKRRLLSVLMSVCLLLALMVVPAAASDANDAIQEARKGILQVAQIPVVNGEEIGYANVGTGFLIGRDDGAQIVITNYHVAHAYTESDIRQLLELDGKAKIDFKLRVVVKRDVFVNASIVNESFSGDFTILRLEQPLYDRSPLTLTDSDNVKTTQDVFALGFPGIVQSIQADALYTSDDVTVTSGIVSKTSDVVLQDAPIPTITHSARVSAGNSGGALTDKYGRVIGVNTFISKDSNSNNDYFYATQINEIRDVLDALGIEYKFNDDLNPNPVPDTKAPEPETEAQDVTPVTPAETEAPQTTKQTEEETEAAYWDDLSDAIDTAKEASTDGMSSDSVDAYNAALDSAESMLRKKTASEKEVNSAIKDLESATSGLTKAGIFDNPVILIVIIAVAVIVIIVIILLVVLSAKKKKAKEEEEAARAAQMRQRPPMGGGMPGGMGGGMTGGYPGQRPGMTQGGPQQQPWQQQPQQQRPPMQGYPQPPMGDDAPTGVLNDGSSDTTILGSGSAVPAATITRMKTGERVTVNKQVFKIGKQRMRVDYCISDNTNISRTHADIVYKNGAFYIVDNNATNGTTVNGAVVRGTEMKLNSGDTIKLADEEFKFQA